MTPFHEFGERIKNTDWNILLLLLILVLQSFLVKAMPIIPELYRILDVVDDNTGTPKKNSHPRGHNGTLPPKSARSYSQAPPGEGLTPHTIHHYSFGPLQAITVVDQSDPDSGTVILTIPSSLLY